MVCSQGYVAPVPRYATDRPIVSDRLAAQTIHAAPGHKPRHSGSSSNGDIDNLVPVIPVEAVYEVSAGG